MVIALTGTTDQTDTGMGDPNAVITRRGVRNFDIYNVFRDFGYYPTQEEIDAIAPSFSGRTDVQQIGFSAVAQYVLHKKSEAERQKNDPLAALQKKMEESTTLMKNQVQGLYGQLQDVLTSHPVLFGDLRPDQIATYLAPLQTAFKTQMDLVQGVIAQRGLAASSTENAALAQTGEQFQEKTLAAGLDVGLQSQQNKAAALESQIRDLLGLTATEEQIAGSAAGQRSSQQLGQSNLLASLPYFLNQSALQQEAIRKQLDKGTSAWDIAERVIGDVGQVAGTVAQFIPSTHPITKQQTSGAQIPTGSAYPTAPDLFQSPVA